MRFKKTRDVKSPNRANEVDAGIDFFVPNDFNEGEPVWIGPGDNINIPAGICVEIPKGYVGVFLNKSGIAKQAMLVGAQVIDCGYTGEVHINLHNVSGDEGFTIQPGQKITQMLIYRVETFYPQEMAANYEFKTYGSNRGDGGFGSTGVK